MSTTPFILGSLMTFLVATSLIQGCSVDYCQFLLPFSREVNQAEDGKMYRFPQYQTVAKLDFRFLLTSPLTSLFSFC